MLSQMSATVGDRVRRARWSWDRSQRELTAETGIPQASLSRIETGDQTPRLNEVLSLAWALGYTVDELTGHSQVVARAECAARADDGADMTGMRDELTHFLALDAFLEDCGVTGPA